MNIGYATQLLLSQTLPFHWSKLPVGSQELAKNVGSFCAFVLQSIEEWVGLRRQAWG